MLASPLRDETGHVIGGALIGRDVTKAREAEAALRASQSRFRALSLQAPVGIFETDLAGRCTFVNEAWCALTGLAEEEALGAGLEPGRSIPDDLARVVFAWDDDGGAGRAFPPASTASSTEDGRVFWVMGAAEAAAGRAPPRPGLPGHRQPTSPTCAGPRSELRRTSEALAAANRELESFSYSVSHDLRAPLRGIDGFSRALEEDYGKRLDAEARGYIARIRNATQRMGQIIDDLLLLSRVARSELRRETGGPLGAGPEVDAALRSRRARRGASSVRGQEDLRAEADGRLVRLLLENLLGNAWKYTSKRERAAWSVAASGGATARPSSSCATTERGSTWPTPTSSSARSRLHSTSEFPGSGSASPPWPASSSPRRAGVGEGEPGRGATFSSPWRRRHGLSDCTILLVEDNPTTST